MKIIALFFIGAVLSGCGPIYRQLNPQVAQREKVDSLISFKEAAASGNYLRAVHKLSLVDQAEILDSKGHVKEEMKPRLRAVRLKNLVNASEVRLKQGRLTGILAALPVLTEGKAVEIDTSFELVEENPEARHRDSLAQELHTAARLLFSDIQAKNWQYVLNDLHPNTRSYFVNSKGKLKEGLRRRLEAIDTTHWQALSLRDGKLVGIVLLLPSPEAGLEKAAEAFFDAISEKRWDAAMDLLVDSEVKALCDSEGKLTPESKKLLANLNPENWDGLLWYHEKLSGLLELIDRDNLDQTR